jgi:nicotinamidase-related amidase
VPFTSTVTITNPLGGAETETTRLWPVHCVQGSKGAELVPEMDVGKVDRIVEKGMDKRVEMYSAFSAPFREPVVADSGLASVLKEVGATHVYVVGLAMDYCVKFTALDAAREGFQTLVISEGTKLVDPEAITSTKEELSKAGVKFVPFNGAEVGWVKDLAKS